MNGDSLELAKMIQSMEQSLSAKMDTHFATMNTFKGSIEARVDDIEEDQRSAQRTQWIHTGVIVPVMTTLHFLAKHFGY